MKIKNILLAISLLLITVSGFSQDCPKYTKNREKIEAEKVSFITEKLNLSVEEAQKFWPVYNEFQKKKDAYFIETRKMHKKLFKNAETMSDKEIIESLDKINNLKVKIVRLEKQYDDKYLTILSAQKVVLLHKSEREFKRTLLKKLKQCEVDK